MHGGDESEVNSPWSSGIPATKSIETSDVEGTKEQASRLCGYLNKLVGKGPLRGFKSRWFVYDPRTCYLYYFRTPQDALPLGYIEIADASFCYDVEGEEGQFEIHTSGKEFLLKAQNAQVMRYWLQQLQQMRWEFCTVRGGSGSRDSWSSPALPQPHSGLVARAAESSALERPSETMEKVRSDFAVETNAEGQVGVHTARSPSSALLPTTTINRSFRQWGTELRNSMSQFRPGRGGESRRSIFHKGRADEWETIDPPEHGPPQDGHRKPSSDTHRNSASSPFTFDFGRSSTRPRRPFPWGPAILGGPGSGTDAVLVECNESKMSEVELRLQSQEEELGLLREELANQKELVRILQQSLMGPQWGRSPMAPTETQDTPTETQDTPTETQDTPIETQDTPTETQDTPTETQDTPTEPQDTPTETQDTPTGTRDTPTETQDTPTKTQDTPTGTQDTPTETQDIPTETRDIPTEPLDMPIDMATEHQYMATELPSDTPTDTSTEPLDTPTDAPRDTPADPPDTSESSLEQECGHVQALRCHLEKLVREKTGLEGELACLRGRVGQVSEQLAMLMETIQAKDQVIMQLSQQGGDTPVADCNWLTSTAQELQELDRLRDSLQGYKSQNKFLNKEILELSVLRHNAETREKALEAKYSCLEAKLCQVESKYLVLLQEVRTPVCSESPARELISRLLEDALQMDNSEEEENPVFEPHPVSEYDVYGFKTVPEDDEEERLVAKVRALDLRSLSLAEQEASVAVRWENYLAGTMTREMARSPELKALVRGGVPHEHRSKVWRRCVALHTRKLREGAAPGYYEGLLAVAREKQNPASKQIELDLLRTLPNNKHYTCPASEGIHKLRNVLLAFSWRNPDIGYCQGLNRLAAIALLYLEEEEAFWCMVSIVEVFMPRDYYTKTLLGSQVDQRVLKDLMSEKLPRLHAHFEQHKVDFSLITFNWFLVLFVDSVVSDILFKIWDAFLYEGPKIIFRFALALFKYSEEEFLKLQDSTAIFKYLRYFTRTILNARKLMAIAFAGMNPFPLRLIQNRRTFHLERVRLELTELEAFRQTFLRERETTPNSRSLLSDDEEDT